MNRKTTEGLVRELIDHVRAEFGTDKFIPLHVPQFGEKEREMVLETLDSGFVSSVGQHVGDFEKAVAEYTGARYAVATVNGTAALHMTLLLSDVSPGDEVITQSVTFVATCNAIRYCFAEPVLIDIDRETLGMSPESLEGWLQENCEIRDDGLCWNKCTGRIVRACVPMHNFGHPVRIREIAQICERWNLRLIEDAAESLGSLDGELHTGRVGGCAAISFNGNKIITTGGGGMIITDDEALARRAKHLTTTAKVPHPWLYQHDEVGYNYRLPALNAALGCAQMERLSDHVERKRALAKRYSDWLSETPWAFFTERAGTRANYWFNAFLAGDREERDVILALTNESGVMTRPIWTPMHTMELYAGCQQAELPNCDWINDRLVNIPSSPPPAR